MYSQHFTIWFQNKIKSDFFLSLRLLVKATFLASGLIILTFCLSLIDLMRFDLLIIFEIILMWFGNTFNQKLNNWNVSIEWPTFNLKKQISLSQYQLLLMQNWF